MQNYNSYIKCEYSKLEHFARSIHRLIETVFTCFVLLRMFTALERLRGGLLRTPHF